MLSVEAIKDYLQENLKEARYKHVLGVVKVAKELARLNGISEERAELAAFGHDIAKNKTIKELENIINENNIILSFEERETKELWHSIVSPILGKSVLNIEDEEVLSAMRWHTTGKPDMTKLEKIIYIADMIEEGRDFPGVEEIREATMKDLDKGVLMGLNHTIKYLLNKNFVIDSNTIKARNYFLINK